jgi:hypothetical protein
MKNNSSNNIKYKDLRPNFIYEIQNINDKKKYAIKKKLRKAPSSSIQNLRKKLPIHIYYFS